MSSDGSDERLNALIDGELSPAETAALLERLSLDEALRDRVGQLKLTRESVRHAYAGVAPPPVTRPPPRATWRWPPFTAFVLFAAGLLMGWLAREGVVGWTGAPGAVAHVPAPAVPQGEPARVILHVSSAAPGLGLATLERAQGLIEAASGSGQSLAIEIVANGPGLDLLREGVSPYATRIESMRASYPALALVACGQTLQKLRDSGVDVRLLPGSVVASSALDQIVMRMQQGWAYVRL